MCSWQGALQAENMKLVFLLENFLCTINVLFNLKVVGFVGQLDDQ